MESSFRKQLKEAEKVGVRLTVEKDSLETQVGQLEAALVEKDTKLRLLKDRLEVSLLSFSCFLIIVWFLIL